MNKVLDYNVTGQNIEWDTAPTLVAGTVNEYTARFSFDADWDGYQRIAVFSVEGVEREQLLTDDACDVPWEVLRPGAYLKVGVYGTRDGSRLPTIWTAHRQYIHDGAGPTEEAAAPSPVLAEQMLQRMGDLGQLRTEDKSSLVAAINEVRETGGGGGTSDHSKLKNRDAADQHPMSAITGLDAALAGKQPVGDYITEEQDPTVPDWAKQPQKPAYTAQEVGALPATTKIPTALSELSEDATHRVVTDAEKATWNAKSNFTGSYNDLTDKPVIPTVPVQSVNGKTGAVVLSADDVGALPDSTVIPAPYTLPIASETTLGGVQPVAKTDEMTQSVGVDAAGGLWAKAASGGGDNAFELIDTIDWSTEEMAVGGAGKEYVLDGVAEILFVCTAIENRTSTVSSLEVTINDKSMAGNYLPVSGKSGTPANGFVWYKLLENAGLIAFRPGTFANSNANYTGVSLNTPYNILPFSGKISKLKVWNRYSYVTISGTLKVYAR